MIEGTILLVGCGKMGGALLDGWFKRGFSPVDAIIVEPAGRGVISHCSHHPALTVVGKVSDVPRDFRPDVVLFAVKPQIVDGVVPDYQRFVAEQPVFLTVVAGKPVSYFRSQLGEKAAIVRAMPNTPATVGKAISVLFAGPEVSDVQRHVCEVLLASVGGVAWVQDERLMDAVTAVSGSGPAYVFLLAECLADAAVEAGLPRDLAARLARNTVAGAGVMLDQLADETAVLRKNVTSPGGTTAAALDVLMGAGGLKEIMTKAVAAAAKRSKELAG